MGERSDITGSAAPSPSPAAEPVAHGTERRFRWLIGPAAFLLVVIVVRAFLLTPFGIPSRSMEDALQVGDRVLVQRNTSPSALERGDIVVFDASEAYNLDLPERGPLQALVESAQGLLGKGQRTDYVKRVVGLPGDRVRCCAADGRLEINGTAVDEPYLKTGQKPSLTTFDVTVPPDRFWMMGDHRGQSADSRAHLGEPGGGMVAGEDIIGKVWVRYWPLDRLGSIDQGQLSRVPRNGE